MLKIYYTIDFEDPLNDESIHTCGRIIEIFSKFNITPIIFITGDVIKKLLNGKDEFQKTISNVKNNTLIGYHTNAHTEPVAFQITDVSSYSLAKKNVEARELLTSIDNNGNISPLSIFLLLFGVSPSSCRFPGFSWTPAYLEILKANGITRSFDLYPEGLAHLPNVIRHKGVTFIKPDYILWVDDLLRMYEIKKIKKEIKILFSKHQYVNISLHPNRFCNKDWWMDHLDAPELLPKYSLDDIDNHLNKLHEILSYITSLYSNELIFHGKIEPSPKINDSKFSLSDIEQIINNAANWPKRKFGYQFTYLQDQFFNYLSE